ncbi:hypothetical protein PHMEG_00033824 [Phytophthora megakarya]|uniref:Reverse transcriptase RNase H-like domain-containing protein n=1 Tax=Phytophthora megakarya TaxID=4795 RepID=A0A225UUV0_9STRA|nr:hypothetical protein PHMEG_00033824 [Phytophthora megakarya]
MTLPDDGCEACLFVDASQGGYAIILTQVSEWNDELMMKDQDHHLIVCKAGCSGIFNCDKEAFPIVKACQDLSYVLQRVNGFRLFCHHCNLFYVFVPKLELKEHVRDRLQQMGYASLGYALHDLAHFWYDKSLGGRYCVALVRVSLCYVCGGAHEPLSARS